MASFRKCALAAIVSLDIGGVAASIVAPDNEVLSTPEDATIPGAPAPASLSSAVQNEEAHDPNEFDEVFYTYEDGTPVAASSLASKDAEEVERKKEEATPSSLEESQKAEGQAKHPTMMSIGVPHAHYDDHYASHDLYGDHGYYPDHFHSAYPDYHDHYHEHMHQGQLAHATAGVERGWGVFKSVLSGWTHKMGHEMNDLGSGLSAIGRDAHMMSHMVDDHLDHDHHDHYDSPYESHYHSHYDSPYVTHDHVDVDSPYVTHDHVDVFR